MKASRSGFIGNLTNCVSRVLIVTDNIQNYDDKCLFENKIAFAVLIIKNITERYCALVSVEEIVKGRQLVNDKNFVPKRR